MDPPKLKELPEKLVENTSLLGVAVAAGAVDVDTGLNENDDAVFVSLELPPNVKAGAAFDSDEAETVALGVTFVVACPPNVKAGAAFDSDETETVALGIALVVAWPPNVKDGTVVLLEIVLDGP